MDDKIVKFRQARHLSKIDPERFKFIVKVFNSQLVWVLWENREMSPKPELHSESHKGVSYWGWNIEKDRAHNPSMDFGLYRFYKFTTEETLP